MSLVATDSFDSSLWSESKDLRVSCFDSVPTEQLRDFAQHDESRSNPTFHGGVLTVAQWMALALTRESRRVVAKALKNFAVLEPQPKGWG